MRSTTVKAAIMVWMMGVSVLSHASHYAGGYISYSTANGTDYSLTLTLFRDCQGLPAAATQQITVSSASLSSSQNVLLTLTGTSAMPLICAAQQAQSTCNGGVLPAYQKVVYTGSVTLSGTAADWQLTFTECCRSGAISNLLNASSYGTMLRAVINNNVGFDTSPVFFSDPVWVIPAGQQQHISWTASDADGDQLVYTLTPALMNTGTAAPYAAGYSAVQPVLSSPAVVFDSLAGDLFLMPTTVQSCVLSMSVSQYRNGVLTGTVSRESLVMVINSANQLPQLFDAAGNHAFDTTICAGEAFSLEVWSSDTAALQILSASWDTLPGMQYTITGSPHPTGSVSWQPSLTDTGTFSFCFRVWDSNCPFMGFNVFPVTINVLACSSPLYATVSYSAIVCNGQLTNIVVNATGGQAPYLYSIDGGVTWQTGNVFANLPADSYTTTVKDAANDTYSTNVVITEPDPLLLDIVTLGDGSLPDTLSASVSGGCLPYLYMWTGNVTQADYVVVADGSYDLTVVDACGCTVTETYSTPCANQCVWPGDADYNGLVDQYDLLPLGLGYGISGPPRANATIAWVPQTAQDWQISVSNNVDLKHSDCDGNGVVHAADTVAILQNWNMVHNKAKNPNVPRAGLPPLAIVLSPDTLTDGDTVVAELFLGNAGNVANEVYALAFNFNFDPEVVDSAFIRFNYTDSWLVDAGDHISLHRTIFNEGRIATALTRVDHSSRSGYGSIGTIEMKVTTGNINGKQLEQYILHTWISNLVVTDENGVQMTYSEGADSAALFYVVTTVPYPANAVSDWRMYPVPASGQVFFDQLPVGDEGCAIELFNNMGERVVHVFTSEKTASVSVAQLPAGIYSVRVGQQIKNLLLAP